MRRLIEVDFPLKKVSEESVREKNIRHGHISTLHIWWARRPLAASRATALAALLPDPGDEDNRKELLQLIEEICPWENSLNQHLLEKARKLIREAYGGRAPKVLDCFAGGGAIPLEALRLGCETYALDYNPVAVLVEKAVLEYPQKYGQPQAVQTQSGDGLKLQGERTVNPLLEAVKKWGNWVLEEARKELEQFYPKDKDGSIPVGYIWARTLPCQNPACGAEIPLIRSFWLAKKQNKKVALRLVTNKTKKQIRFDVAEGEEIDFDPQEGTVSRAYVRCPVCNGTIDDDTTRRLSRDGKSCQRMLAVVLHHPQRTGKTYRLPTERDLAAWRSVEAALEKKRKELWAKWGMDPVPDEPLTKERPSPNARGLSALTRYEMKSWGELFNSRQKLALVTFAEKVRQAYCQILNSDLDADLARAITIYQALTIDRLADYNTSLCTWVPNGEFVGHTFTRQALGMVWDSFELNPFSGATGDWISASGWVQGVLSHCSEMPHGCPVEALNGSACALPWPDNYFDGVFTDPPYYDNVPYADLSDFFYVWLKRSVGDLYPGLFSTPLTPKSEEAIWHQRHGGSYEAGKQVFEERITAAFREISRVLKPDGTAVVVFAHKTTEAWEAIINALLRAGVYMIASWPVHTEMEERINAQETASLASSIYMVCRKRTSTEIGEFPKVRREIEDRVKQRLAHFWDEGIRGADFFMSAIGPAVEAFGRYAGVEKLSGELVEVKELLEYVRKIVSEYALERILGASELGGIDPETRFYLLWRWTYDSAKVPFGEANKLAQAVGTELSALWNSGDLVQKEKEYVRVLGPKDREKDAKFLRQEKFTTMVDALHRAVLYWEKNQREKLKEHLANTYGGNDAFWQVAQHIAEVLPEGDKEKQLIQGLLYGSKSYAVPEPVQTGKLF